MQDLLKYKFNSGYQFPVYDPCANVFSVAADWGLQGTQDLELALSQPFKIVCVRPCFNEPHIFNYHSDTAVNFDQFDLVLVSDIEYTSIETIKQWLDKNNISNSLLALGGKVDPEHFDSSCMVYRYFWASQYTLRDTYIDTCRDVKPFMFDVLLGARRPHRDYVMLAMTTNGMLDSNIVTYRDFFIGNITNHQSQEFANLYPSTKLNFPYTSPNLNPEWEVSDQLSNSISSLIPYEIYKQCYYSVITETLGTGSTFFFSEKAAKAMFAQRLFISFSNANYLKELRKLGFETFGNVIDESFDSDILDFSRFAKTIEQMKMLANENPKLVLEKVQYTLQHNHHQLKYMIVNYRTNMVDLLRSVTPSGCWID
jgi:hypothetical protein